MITEEDVIRDKLYESIHFDTYIADIMEDERNKDLDLVQYLMEDFSLDKHTAEILLEMYYLSNLDFEPNWK